MRRHILPGKRCELQWKEMMITLFLFGTVCWFNWWNDLRKRIFHSSCFLAPFKKKSYLRKAKFCQHASTFCFERVAKYSEKTISFTFVRHLWVIQPVDWSSFKAGILHSSCYLALTSIESYFSKSIPFFLVHASSLSWPAVVKINFNFTSIRCEDSFIKKLLAE